MDMQPTIAGETWTDLASALVRLDDGDVYLSHLPHTIEDRQDPEDTPLLRAIFRVEADLLLTAADRVRPDRGLMPPDHERLQDDACEELVHRLRAAFERWSASPWFPAVGTDDHTSAAELGNEVDEIAARVAANHAEVRASILAMMPRTRSEV
jgi:hypothetical protein